MEDFPAAHSMDTTWFAVDKDGRVAAFDTGEAGAVPTDAYLGEDVPFEALHALPQTAARKDDPEAEDFYDDDMPPLSRFGFVLYSHSTDNFIAGPYNREQVPERFVAVSELPAEVREHLVKFSGSFVDTLAIQPVELWPSEAWGAAWLATDKKTVRPIAGRMKDYAEEAAMALDADPSLVLLDEAGQPYTPKVKPTAPPAAKVQTKLPWWMFWKK